MRRAILAIALLLTLPIAHAQQPEQPQTSITVNTTLVEVPAMVKGKDNQIVFALKAEDFLLTDNGAPQHLHLDEDTDSQPLALAVVIQNGGAAARHLDDYHQLDPILEALIGNVEHSVTLIAFDSQPQQLIPFTPVTADVANEIDNLQPGDQGANILDAVAYAVQQLRDMPPRYRRAILLISETIDQGSATKLGEAVRLISDTNTIMYTFGFSSTRAAVSHEASKFNSSEPGPAHGCFSKNGADAEYKGHYSKQVLDCISQLAPPLRFATMAYLAARESLRTNTAESIANLTGGEYFHFKDAKSLQKGLVSIANDVPNYYMLSFHPTDPTPGPHALHLELKNNPGYTLKSRSQYWIDDTSSQPPPPSGPVKR
jgi:VWFA-related protein